MTDIDVKTVVKSIKKQLGSSFTIDVAIVLGSGLGASVEALAAVDELPYRAINGFPQSTAPGHRGCLLIAKYKSLMLAVFQGRFHLYEGWSAKEVALPSYVSHHLGAKHILFMNAAGALNPEFKSGDLMLVQDHINFTGHSPLRGNNEGDGPRFPDLSQVYSHCLQAAVCDACRTESIMLRKGIYAGVLGPQLETSAERRFFRLAGADAVGMSLVMETIAAIYCGMNVLALAAITNVATGLADQQPDTIEKVLQNAARASYKISKLLPLILDQIEQV